MRGTQTLQECMRVPRPYRNMRGSQSLLRYEGSQSLQDMSGSQSLQEYEGFPVLTGVYEGFSCTAISICAGSLTSCPTPLTYILPHPFNLHPAPPL